MNSCVLGVCVYTPIRRWCACHSRTRKDAVTVYPPAKTRPPPKSSHQIPHNLRLPPPPPPLQQSMSLKTLLVCTDREAPIEHPSAPSALPSLSPVPCPVPPLPSYAQALPVTMIAKLRVDDIPCRAGDSVRLKTIKTASHRGGKPVSQYPRRHRYGGKGETQGGGGGGDGVCHEKYKNAGGKLRWNARRERHFIQSKNRDRTAQQQYRSSSSSTVQ